MNIYIYIMAMMVFLYIIDYLYAGKYQNKAFFILTSVLLALFCLKDGSVGNDSAHYTNFFLGKSSMYGMLNDTSYSGDLLYAKWCLFLKSFSNIELWYIFASYMMLIPIIFYTIYKYAENKIFALFVFFATFNMLTTTMVAFRQNMATSMILFGVNLYFLSDKKVVYKILAYILFVVSYFFHSSSLLIAPLCLLLLKLPQIPRKKANIALSLSFVVYIVSSNIFSSFMENIHVLFSFMGMDRLDIYTSDSSSTYIDTSWVRTFLYTLLGFVLLNGKSYDKQHPIFYNSAFIAVFIHNLFSEMGLIERTLYVFVVLGACTSPLLCVKRQKKQFLISLVVMIVFIVVNYRDMESAPDNFSELLPYKFSRILNDFL